MSATATTRDRRRRIARAIRHGELLANPDDAQELVRRTGRARRALGGRRRHLRLLFRIALLLSFAGQVIAGLVRSHGSVPGWSLVVPAFWLLLEGWGFVRLRRLPSQVAAADERHRRYLEQLGYPIPVEDGDLEPTKPPFRRPPWIAAGLVVATFALMFLLASLPVLDHRASPWRLVVYGVVCVAAVVLTATAAVLCARWLPREHRWRGRIEVGLLLVIAAALAVAWTVGLVRVLFFGA